MRIRNILQKAMLALYTSMRRFPVTIAFSVSTVIMVMINSELDRVSTVYESFEVLKRIAMVLAMGVPLSLCLKQISERNGNTSSKTQALSYFGVVLFLIIYFFYVLQGTNHTDVTRYIAISLALYLGFLFIPYFYKRESFELYVTRLSTRWLVTVVYSTVLFIGIAIILFTLNTLLSVPVAGVAYFYVWLGIIGVFSPSFFLAGVPAYGEQLEKNDYPKLLKILLLNIVMPLIAIYTTILYIYFAKIIVTLQWPEGLVSHLVLWYSVVSIGVIIFISPVRNENRWARQFVFWFPRLNLPILLMMFISIGIRIKAYGVTENRYFVVALGLWVFASMLYLSIARVSRNITVLVSLAIIAVLAVVGPWSAFSVSKFSQNQRFQQILEKNDMIQNNAIVKSASEVSAWDQREISEILYYFRHTHSYSDVKYLPKDYTSNQMEKVFGFRENLGRYYHEFFSVIVKNAAYPLDVRGYDYFFDFGPVKVAKDHELEVSFSDKDTRLQVLYKGQSIYEKQLNEYAEQLYSKYGDDRKAYPIHPDEATFVDENSDVRLKIVIGYVSGRNDAVQNVITIENMNFYVLLKLK